MKSEKIQLTLSILSLAIIASALQFSTPNIADPDAFYHLAHAKIYAERGIFYAEFPWAQFSVIKDLKADIWYGFHLFLIPFTYIPNGILGIKIAGAFITLLTLLAFYWSLIKLNLKWPLASTLFLILIAPDVMYRLTMTRPHNLTLALVVIIFALIWTRGRGFLFSLLGFLSAWLHIALSWLPIFINLISNLVLKTRREPIPWKNTVYLAAGSIIGVLARPHPWGALKLAYIQVVDIIFIKFQNIPLAFGRELKPPYLDTFLRNTLPLAIIIIVSLIVYRIVRSRLGDPKSKHYQNIFFSSLAISFIFFFITTFVARRSYDIFIGFGLIAAAATLTLWSKQEKPGSNKKILAGLIIIVGLAGLNSIPVFKKYNRDAWTPTYLKTSALWLKENTQPGEIVFHTNWDQFGSLFFWNQQNYYINGMDPIFQYAYDPALYWKNHFMFSDKAYSHTCGRLKCTAAETENTPQVLAQDFKASYIVLRKAQNPNTFINWVAKKTFPLVFETKSEVIFKITPR